MTKCQNVIMPNANTSGCKDEHENEDADEDKDELSLKECPPKAAPTSVQSKSVLNISSVWFTGNSKMASVWRNRSF